MRTLTALVLAALALAPGDVARADDATATTTRPETLDDRERALHVLSRLAYGPRPGEVERVAAEGWRAWVERQLAPESIDDEAAARRVQSFGTLWLSCREVVGRFAEGDKKHVPAAELASSVLLRATYSERQFQEVIVDFWRNHFNVSAEKGVVAQLAVPWEREVLRAHAFGKFEHLLMASAKHAAMLEYLDNSLSQKPISEREKKYLASASRNFFRNRGLNENYARELMELHTLGVDNTYSQQDVTEVARALTGWTYASGKDADYEFRFRHEVHDFDAKRVRGNALPMTRESAPDEGVREGEVVVIALARARGTARFIAAKLCRYLVGDAPDEQLVDDVAKVFRETDGDLRAVYRAIVLDERFYSRRCYRAKFKTPFELVVSSLRALGANVTDTSALRERLLQLGQPIYLCLEPTGYSDQAEAWQDPGVMSARWRLALDLVRGAVDGVAVDEAALTAIERAKDPGLALERFVPSGVSAATRQRLDRAGPHLRAALTLGSPEFQLQ
jgi:uncharacterized protein (DUF1800 family)